MTTKQVRIPGDVPAPAPKDAPAEVITAEPEPAEVESGRPSPTAALKMTAKQLEDALSALPPAQQKYMLSKEGWTCGRKWHTHGRRPVIE
jgi:hypothetical protein